MNNLLALITLVFASCVMAYFSFNPIGDDRDLLILIGSICVFFFILVYSSEDTCDDDPDAK